MIRGHATPCAEFFGGHFPHFQPAFGGGHGELRKLPMAAGLQAERAEEGRRPARETLSVPATSNSERQVPMLRPKSRSDIHLSYAERGLEFILRPSHAWLAKSCFPSNELQMCFGSGDMLERAVVHNRNANAAAVPGHSQVVPHASRLISETYSMEKGKACE
jgi:hypothetical protein